MEGTDQEESSNPGSSESCPSELYSDTSLQSTLYLGKICREITLGSQNSSQEDGYADIEPLNAESPPELPSLDTLHTLCVENGRFRRQTTPTVVSSKKNIMLKIGVLILLIVAVISLIVCVTVYLLVTSATVSNTQIVLENCSICPTEDCRGWNGGTICYVANNTLDNSPALHVWKQRLMVHPHTTFRQNYARSCSYSKQSSRCFLTLMPHSRIEIKSGTHLFTDSATVVAGYHDSWQLESCTFTVSYVFAPLIEWMNYAEYDLWNFVQKLNYSSNNNISCTKASTVVISNFYISNSNFIISDFSAFTMNKGCVTSLMKNSSLNVRSTKFQLKPPEYSGRSGFLLNITNSALNITNGTTVRFSQPTLFENSDLSIAESSRGASISAEGKNVHKPCTTPKQPTFIVRNTRMKIKENGSLYLENSSMFSTDGCALTINRLITVNNSQLEFEGGLVDVNGVIRVNNSYCQINLSCSTSNCNKTLTLQADLNIFNNISIVLAVRNNKATCKLTEECLYDKIPSCATKNTVYIDSNCTAPCIFHCS